MTTGPGDELARAGRGGLRASHADREQAIELLKAAFVQDRLDKNELDARVGRALASRTYADLAALIADIPAMPAPAVPVTAMPARAVPAPAVLPGTPVRTLVTAACRAGMCLLGGLVLIWVISLVGHGLLGALAFLGVVAAPVAASGFLGYGVVDAWQQRRTRGQLPPRPGRNGQAPEGRRGAAAGDDLAPPGARPDQTQVNLAVVRQRRRVAADASSGSAKRQISSAASNSCVVSCR